jgi:hypothetical protein
MATDHRLLHRRQLAGRREPLDRDDMRTVHLEHELDARVDHLVAQPAILTTPDEDRTGAAVPLLAHDLRPGGALILAQKPRHRLKRPRPADAVRDAVDMEEDEVAHGWWAIVRFVGSKVSGLRY